MPKPMNPYPTDYICPACSNTSINCYVDTEAGECEIECVEEECFGYVIIGRGINEEAAFVNFKQKLQAKQKAVGK